MMEIIIIDKKEYEVVKIMSTSFDLDGKHYPIGSYLIRQRGENYYKGMTEEEYGKLIRRN